MVYHLNVLPNVMMPLCSMLQISAAVWRTKLVGEKTVSDPMAYLVFNAESHLVSSNGHNSFLFENVA